MPSKEPTILTPQQTLRVHREMLVALTKGMGGRLVMRIGAQTTGARIVTTVTDAKNGSLDVELVLLEKTNDPG